MSFRIPEQFRRPNAVNGLYASNPGDTFGVFVIPGRDACGRSLQVIACDGTETGWEHVSVSVEGQPTRIPSWPEMCVIKDLFWADEDCVVQFHPPKADYINNHPGCLHLWRPVSAPIPTPPNILV